MIKGEFTELGEGLSIGEVKGSVDVRESKQKQEIRKCYNKTLLSLTQYPKSLAGYNKSPNATL